MKKELEKVFSEFLKVNWITGEVTIDESICGTFRKTINELYEKEKRENSKPSWDDF